MHLAGEKFYALEKLINESDCDRNSRELLISHHLGTEMANEGMPLPALANLLGHSDVKLTMRYYNMNKKTIARLATFSTGGALVNS